MPGLKPWHWPLLAAVLTLAAVVVGYVIVFHSLQQVRPSSASVGAEEVEARVRAGEKALAAGRFRLAADELQRARSLLEQRPQLLGASRAREIGQLQRQADLLADLLSESLGEILQRAAGMQEEEWEAQFARRCEGHAVIFDADVTRAGAGELRVDYLITAGAEPARLEVSDLKVLAGLPRERPPRLLFGARLASMRREPPGTWVVRFAPESGVLLSDSDAAAACCPPPIDEELLALVKRQHDWLGLAP